MGGEGKQTERGLGGTGGQPGPLWDGFFLHETLLCCLLRLSGEPRALLCHHLYTYMIVYTYITQTTHNTYVVSHMEKRPATGSTHLCAVLWGMAAPLPCRDEWLAVLDWGSGASRRWSSMLSIDCRVRLTFSPACMGHSAGWYDSECPSWNQWEHCRWEDLGDK